MSFINNKRSESSPVCCRVI